MGFRRRHRILSAGKSPSRMAMERTYRRAILNGGVTVDFSVNVENIREISRKLGYNILKTPVRRNLVTFSEELTNSIWIKTNITVTQNSNLNPFGSSKSFYIEETVANATHLVAQATPVTAGEVYTASWYVKKADDTWIQPVLGLSFTPNDIWANFNLDSGSFGNIGNGIWSSQSLTNGYYKISVTATATNSNPNGSYFIGGTNNTDSPTKGPIYVGTIGHRIADVAAVQFERGSIATNYQMTQNAPMDGDFTNANFLYVPSSYGEGKNFAQVHNKRNLLQWSEDFGNVIWTKAQTAVTSDAISNPIDGIINADLLRQDGVSTALTRRVSYSISISGVYTFSCYAKKKDFDGIIVQSIGGTAIAAAFNITNGTVINSAGTPKIEPIGTSGWYRVSISGAVVSSTRLDITLCDASGNVVFNNTNTFGNYIWGAQLEQGAYATPYQKTVASGDGIVDFNFTRATSARVTNKQGVIEDSCYNLLQRSEELDNASWTKSNSSITANAVVNPINGQLTADKFFENNVNTTHLLQQAISVQQGSNYTMSGYVKASGRTRFQLKSGSIGVLNTSVDFDLSTATGSVIINANATATISPLPDGWFYFVMSSTVPATSTTGINMQFFLAVGAITSYLGDNASGIYLWGLQTVQGSTPRPYLRTTNRLNVSRLDYSRGTGEPELLIERASTNLALQSEDFSNAVWIKSNTTITLNTILNPFGVSKVYSLTEDTTNILHSLAQNINVTSGTTYSAFVYLKKASHSWVQVSAGLGGFGSNTWVNFNFDTGVFGNGNNISVFSKELLQNGWWKISFTAPATSTVSTGVIAVYGTNNTDSATRNLAYLGTNSIICYLSAVQVETGSTTTTYIPTTTATVTRNAETSYVDLFNNSVLSASNWTLYYEGFLYDGSGSGMSFCLSDTTTAASNTNQIGWFDSLQPFYNISNVRTSSGVTVSANTFNRFAIQYNNGIADFYVNGVNVWSNRTIAVFNYRYLVLSSGGSTFTTDKIVLFNRTLTPSEMILLTS